MAPPLPTQVLILSPAFLKYIHDNWTQHRGRYPSTGFTALLFALHACQQVSTSQWDRALPLYHHCTSCLHALRVTELMMALADVCAGVCVWLWSRQ